MKEEIRELLRTLELETQAVNEEIEKLREHIRRLVAVQRAAYVVRDYVSGFVAI